MPERSIELGIITDEISRDLPTALDYAEKWGIHRFELREGSLSRFPGFTPEEVKRVEEAVAQGALITAVSPGLFKGSVEDKRKTRFELDFDLSRSIELARRFGCPVLIVFSFSRVNGEPVNNRAAVLHALERVAFQADEAGMKVAIENEPGFWVNTPGEAIGILMDLDHPAVYLNWDPANLHWGGHIPDHRTFEKILPYLVNLHVKDYYPKDPQKPWRPVGKGETPWRDILGWVVAESDLSHITIETHCEPLVGASKQSIDAVREILEQIDRDRQG